MLCMYNTVFDDHYQYLLGYLNCIEYLYDNQCLRVVWANYISTTCTKGKVSRYIRLRFFIKQLLLVSLDMPRNDIAFFRIFVELFTTGGVDQN